MKSVLIIGCGITGATLAYKHKQKGDNVTIVDKRSHIGGNVYTENVNGIDVHKYGAHIFHTNDKEVWDFVNQFVEFNDYGHQVKTRFDNRLYSLPINMNTFREFFDIEDANEITNEHIDHIKEKLYNGYSAKQWQRQIEDIDKSVIDRLPIRQTFDNNYFDDKYQGIPIGGYTKLVAELLKGCELHLNTKITQEYNFNDYDVVYNTSPIDEFMDYQLGELEYRSLNFVEECHEVNYFQDYAVINEAEISVPYTRVIEHKHFANSDAKGTIITVEYPKAFDGTNERYYTVNNEKNNNLHKKYKELAHKKYPNMIFCGRLGDFKYYDMDDAIKRALELAGGRKGLSALHIACNSWAQNKNKTY